MFEILCKERFKEAMELSREHRDQTFSNCMMRLLSYLTWNNADKVRLTRDWDEHCFNFAVLRADGSVMLNGGVIFHGFPESGYKQNGSVQIDPSYGWQIHT